MPKKMRDPRTGVVLEVADYSIELFKSLGYKEARTGGAAKRGKAKSEVKE